MALDKLATINAAFGIIGEPVAKSLTENTKKMRHANQIYDIAVSEAYAIDIDFHFTTVWTELATLSTDPDFGYEKQFAYPAKAVRILASVDENNRNFEYEWRTGLAIIGTAPTRVFLTDQSTAFVRYIYRTTDEAFWPGWFHKLVYMKLAMLLSGPLRADESFKITFTREFTAAIADAESSNAAEKGANVNARGVNKELGNDDLVDAGQPTLSGLPDDTINAITLSLRNGS